MPDQSREAMPDIISAKCFGCGNVVKVPAALGGKKARCPKCTNTITIPSLSDTSEDLVGDEMLPEVAREDEELEGKYIDDDGVIQSLAPPRAAPARRPSPSRNARGRGGRGTGTRGPARPAKSNTALIVGIAAGALLLVVLIAVAAGGNKGDGKAKSHAPAKSSQTPTAPESSEDADLGTRCMYYARAVNGDKSDVNLLMKYYAYEPDDEKAVKRGIYRLM